MTDEKIPNILDLSLYTGSSTRLPRATRFNKLREILNKQDTCWLCSNYSKCFTVDRILNCSKVKYITEKLNKEDYYDKK